jgi:hypothetical protein
MCAWDLVVPQVLFSFSSRMALWQAHTAALLLFALQIQDEKNPSEHVLPAPSTEDIAASCTCLGRRLLSPVESSRAPVGCGGARPRRASFPTRHRASSCTAAPARSDSARPPRVSSPTGHRPDERLPGYLAAALSHNPPPIGREFVFYC